jgi:cell division protein FtsW
MIILGILLAMTATPMVANRIGVEEFYFLKRHLLYTVPSLLVIFFISVLDNANIKKFALYLFLFSIFLMILTIFWGPEIKGAHRWIPVFGVSLQPSEFAKPALAIITAWMFAKQHKNPEVKGKFIASSFLTILIILLVLQPDIGMIVVVMTVWLSQLFLNGLPFVFMIVFCATGICGFVLAYLLIPHVTARVDRFLDPITGDHYQINRSLEAFSNGGPWGVGPGEGIVKKHIPDAHADFVFAVLGEEFGFFICAFVIILVAFVVIYGILKSIKENNLFNILASVGLLIQFGSQSFINIASALHIIPTKGMTLPFMSYGGSSMFATSITVGMILALGRRKIILLEE